MYYEALFGKGQNFLVNKYNVGRNQSQIYYINQLF